MRQDMNNYVDMEHMTERNNTCMIRKIANLAINKGLIKDLDTLRTLGGQHTSGDALDGYIAATGIDEGN
jgi:hypothetical protein